MLAWTILALRTTFAVLWFLQGSPAAIVAAISEGISVAFGISNQVTAPSRDRSAIGLLVPLCYLAGGALQPTGTPHLAAELVFIATTAAGIWALFHLGRCHSVAEPTFIGVVDSGPYAWCRHPLAGLRMVSRIALLACWPSIGNAVLVAICLALAWIAARVEERFLLSCSPDYATYAQRVPWRFVPGVI